MTLENYRKACLKAVADEPELPDEMPSALWITLQQAVLKNRPEIVEEAFRLAVRQAKDGIRERIDALPTELEAATTRREDKHGTQGNL